MVIDKVRLFLEAAVGKDEVEGYIKHDHWVEFPARSIQRILDEYERLLKQAENDTDDYS